MNQEKDNQRQAVLVAYLAGIIDGEGTIGIQKNRGLGQYHVAVRVGMAHRKTCELLQEVFGGNVNTEGRVQNSNRQQIFRWSLLKREDLKTFFEAIKPYIRIKSRQLELALEWLELKMRDSSKKPVRLTETELRRREYFYLKMKEFNAVGAAATTNWEDTGDGEVIV